MKWLAAGLLMASTAAMAETPPAPGALTLKRVFASPALSGSAPRLLKLSPDGRMVTLLKPRPDDRERFDLWAIDTSAGAERMLVDSLKLGSGAELSEAEKMQRERARLGGSRGIVSYHWASDGKRLLVPLDGELFLAGTDGSAKKLVGGGVLNPAISPRGGFASFVRDQNLVVTDLASGTERRLTDDGKGTVHWGEAEFVAQEEMDRSEGYWWSPDERYIAVERFDEAPVGIVTRAAIGADGTKVFNQRYPAAGTANALVELHVMRPDGSGRVKVDLGPDRDIYLARVDWAPDGSALFVQRQTRDQKTLDMLRVDPATGRAIPLFRETADHWVDLSGSYRFLKDGSLIWKSARSGHSHLWRLATGQWTQLTSGDWEVAGLAGVDEGSGRIFFTGNRDGVLERHLYAVDIARPGQITRLSEAGYWNDAVMDRTASRAIISRSSPAQPPQTYLADATGKRLAWLFENRLDAAHPYAPYLASHVLPEFGTMAAADGSVLHWRMLSPKREAGRRYPVFMQHYGGPTAQTVTRSWTSPLHQYLVDRGWIVFEIDNRGSANRGTAFERQLYHAMGTVEVADQVAGASWLKSLPYVDAKRIVTYGWSYGGYLTAKLLSDAPGVFAGGIAGAPVTKWQLYDTHYTERYLGDPRRVPDVYKRANVVEQSVNIRNPLLLIHGMADDNVVLDNATQLAAKMQGAAVPFEMMLYPGETHRVGGPGVDEHLWTTILNFAERVAPAAK